MRKQTLAALIAAAISSGAFAQTTGPSSSQTPYITPTAAGWSVTSIITAGNPDATPTTADNGYKMVGIPDGMGAYDNGNGTFTVLMNHELGSTQGISRAHGAAGAFVSEWVIRKSDFRVLSGADLATSHLVSSGAGTWAPATGSANSFNRLCSADLPAVSAFFNATSGMGTQSRIFMNGEESGNEGRAYGFVATGTDKGKAYELPSLGKFSWENSVANPFSGDKTVVIGLDDSTPGQVYVYSGMKTNSGNEVQRAGLDGGTLKGIKVDPSNTNIGGTINSNANLEQGPINGSFTTVTVNTANNGATQQADSRTAQITEFARPEDGAWASATDFYFVTTGADPDRVTGSNPSDGPIGTQSARLYKLTFASGAGGVDYDNGTVSMVLDSASLTGTDGVTARSFDNITVDDTGRVVIQEDPGNDAYIAKTWIFDPSTGTATQIFESDRARFLGAGALTQDEESSGVIEITSVLNKGDGNRYYLGNMQAHYNIAGELVQGGQLYVMTAVPEPETYALMLGGLGLVSLIARRRKTATK